MILKFVLPHNSTRFLNLSFYYMYRINMMYVCKYLVIDNITTSLHFELENEPKKRTKILLSTTISSLVSLSLASLLYIDNRIRNLI